MKTHFSSPTRSAEFFVRFFRCAFIFCMFQLLHLESLKCQIHCSTLGGSNSPGVLPQGSGLPPGPFTMKVYMHIIRRSDGSGGITLSQLEESKVYLDDAFAPIGIYFGYHCEVIYINSDLFYSCPWIHLCG